MVQREWWRAPIWWREEAWKYAGLAFSIAFFVIVGRAIWLDYPLDSGEVREWIGALSGWVAAAAAVITINFVSRQTRAAEKAVSDEANDRREREARASAAVINWMQAVRESVERGKAPGFLPHPIQPDYPSGPRQAIEDSRFSDRDKAALRGLDDAIQRCSMLSMNSNGSHDYVRFKHQVEARFADAEWIASREYESR